MVVDVFWEQPEPEVETDAVVTLAPEQLCMAAAEALFEALHAAAISGVHFAAKAALHEEDLVEAAAAEVSLRQAFIQMLARRFANHGR